jgi:hypothetical protein
VDVEKNGGRLLRRPKLTLSCSAEGKEGRKEEREGKRKGERKEGRVEGRNFFNHGLCPLSCADSELILE